MNIKNILNDIDLKEDVKNPDIVGLPVTDLVEAPFEGPDRENVKLRKAANVEGAAAADLSSDLSGLDEPELGDTAKSYAIRYSGKRNLTQTLSMKPHRFSKTEINSSDP